MPIGSGPDYYNGNNPEENARVKLANEVNEWWEDLDESEKLDVIEGIYPDQVGLIDSDELWERIDWNIKLDSYKEANDYND